jgi:tetratricopeptide (TPR) repeat protein
MILHRKSTDDYAEEGNVLFDEGKFSEAAAVWSEGLMFLPEPQNAQSEAVWFETSIADAYFMLGDFQNASAHILNARTNISGEGYTNPFVMLRSGQCALETGSPDAAEYLLRAYMLAGEEIFESEDPKYFAVIKDMV